MLSDVLGNFIDSASEREFDAPFIEMLRAMRYRDIHFLHGSFEFGKDFIAKRETDDHVDQCAIQSKAGDLNQDGFRKVRLQLDEIRMNSRAHPGFDTDLPLVVILVITGRLTGGASVSAQEYVQYVQRTDGTRVEIWDREDLLSTLSSHPEAGLAGNSERILSIVGRIADGTVSDRDIETFSRCWAGMGSSHREAAIAACEAGVLVNRLRTAGRADLACYAYIWLLRAVRGTEHPGSAVSIDLTPLAESAVNGFAQIAGEMKSALEWAIDPRTLLEAHREDFMLHFTYPARVLRLAELVGLLGLLQRDRGEDWGETAEALEDFFAGHSATSRPLSDRWATGLIPPLLLLHLYGKRGISSELTALIKWTCDHYEGGPGLANQYATPREEMNYQIGATLEVATPRRRESYLATVVLDLAVATENIDLYRAAVNDFAAVDAYPLAPEVDDSGGQYWADGQGIAFDRNAAYDETWSEGGPSAPARHYDREPTSYRLERLGARWDLLAIWTCLRDRHSPGMLGRLLSADPEPGLAAPTR